MDKKTRTTATEAAYKAAFDMMEAATRLLLEAGVAAADGNQKQALGIAVAVEADIERALALIRAGNAIGSL